MVTRVLSSSWEDPHIGFCFQLLCMVHHHHHHQRTPILDPAFIHCTWFIIVIRGPHIESCFQSLYMVHHHHERNAIWDPILSLYMVHHSR